MKILRNLIYVFIIKINSKIMSKEINISWQTKLSTKSLKKILKLKKITLEEVKITKKLKISKGVKLLDKVELHGEIEIGENTSINGPNTSISSEINKIKIGNFCSIASGVKIQDSYHKYNRITSYYIEKNIFKSKVSDIYSKGEIIIEDDVWIGLNVIILSGVKIGRGSIIGAGSIVTKNIPPYSIAVGNPAKVIKKRFETTTINELENLEWWKWSLKEIEENKLKFREKKF